MHNHDIGGELGTTINQKSEKILIYNLLDDPIFSSLPIQRLMATYPSAPFASKPQIIKDIMMHLWEGDDHRSVFEAFAVFDVYLAVSGKRGHFIHQFEVYILGLNLIKSIIRNTQCIEKTFGFSNYDEVARTWLIVATAHDFGYPIESSSKILKALSSLYGQFGLTSLEKKYGDMQTGNVLKFEKDFLMVPVVEVDEYVCKIYNYLDLNILIKQSILDGTDLNESQCIELMHLLLCSDNHGYASAILLCQNILRRLLKHNSLDDLKSDWMFNSLKKSISSISLHSLKVGQKPSASDIDYISHINFDKNPFAYILFIIDNVQDWDRTVHFDPNYAEYLLKDCSLSDTSVSLHYLVRHANWSDKTEQDIRNSIFEKRQMLNMPKGPSKELGIQIKVLFEFANGSEREEVSLNI